MLAIIEMSAKRREPAYTSKKRKEEEEKEEAHFGSNIRVFVIEIASLLPGILGATTRDRRKSELASRKRTQDPMTLRLDRSSPPFIARVQSR